MATINSRVRPIPRLRPAVFFTVCLFLLMCLSIVGARLEASLIPAPTAQSTSKNSRKIVFSVFIDNHTDISTMDSDGSNLMRLTDGESSNSSPSWSPDGQHIAFLSNREGNWEIYVMDEDGSNVVNISQSSADDWSFVWSPDSQQIAFQTQRDSPGHLTQVYTVNIDGSNLINRTTLFMEAEYAAWKPNGDELVFQGSDGLYLLDPTHALPFRLFKIPNSSNAYQTSWSPDGQHIAVYSSNKLENAPAHFYVMNAGGSNLVGFGDLISHSVIPVWSPDGQSFVFTRLNNEARVIEIWSVHMDGTGLTRLTDETMYATNPDWSPDGKQFVFSNRVDGIWQIFTMNADGSNLHQLTYNTYDSVEPKWQP